MEIKHKSGNIIECKQIDSDGIPIGIVKGYIATWDIDSWSDQFVKGCFREDLEKKRMEGRPLPLKNEHSNVIGKFPIETITEDDFGLYGEAQINLEVQDGREMYSLAKQGAVFSFSIGYIAQEKEMINGVRVIKKSRVLEGSMVGNPMNEAAQFTEVKSRDSLPKKYAGYDYYSDGEENAYMIAGVKVADYIDGELKLIPRAVIHARFELTKSAKEERKNEKEIVNQLYKELGFEKPFVDEFKRFNKTEIKSARMSALLDIFRKHFSEDACKFIVDSIYANVMAEEKSTEIAEGYRKLIASLKGE